MSYSRSGWRAPDRALSSSMSRPVRGLLGVARLNRDACRSRRWCLPDRRRCAKCPSLARGDRCVSSLGREVESKAEEPLVEAVRIVTRSCLVEETLGLGEEIESRGLLTRLVKSAAEHDPRRCRQPQHFASGRRPRGDDPAQGALQVGDQDPRGGLGTPRADTSGSYPRLPSSLTWKTTSGSGSIRPEAIMEAARRSSGAPPVADSLLANFCGSGFTSMAGPLFRPETAYRR